jgi:hypothetical protein
MRRESLENEPSSLQIGQTGAEHPLPQARKPRRHASTRGSRGTLISEAIIILKGMITRIQESRDGRIMR